MMIMRGISEILRCRKYVSTTLSSPKPILIDRRGSCHIDANDVANVMRKLPANSIRLKLYGRDFDYSVRSLCLDTIF